MTFYGLTALYQSTLTVGVDGRGSLAMDVITLPADAVEDLSLPALYEAVDIAVLREDVPLAPDERSSTSVSELVDAMLSGSRRLPDFWARGEADRVVYGSPDPYLEAVDVLVSAPLVPYLESPLEGQSLVDLATKAGSEGVALGAYASNRPILILYVAAGVIILQAAQGIGDGLREGLRAVVLRSLGADPGAHEPDDCDASDD